MDRFLKYNECIELLNNKITRNLLNHLIINMTETFCLHNVSFSNITTLNTATGILGTLNLSFSLSTALYKLGYIMALYKLSRRSQFIRNLPEAFISLTNKFNQYKDQNTGKCI